MVYIQALDGLHFSNGQRRQIEKCSGRHKPVEKCSCWHRRLTREKCSRRRCWLYTFHHALTFTLFVTKIFSWIIILQDFCQWMSYHYLTHRYFWIQHWNLMLNIVVYFLVFFYFYIVDIGKRNWLVFYIQQLIR